MSLMYLVIGAPGQGKSPFAQKMIEGRRCLVLDINNEYGSRTKYAGQQAIGLSVNVREPRSRYVGYDLKQFTEIAISKTETVIVMEEATAFFRGKQSQLTSRLIIGRKHTRNVLVFLFHSINRVPPEIMEMAEIIVLLRTNDQDRVVKGKYLSIYEHYLAAKNFKPGEKLVIKML